MQIEQMSKQSIKPRSSSRRPRNRKRLPPANNISVPHLVHILGVQSLREKSFGSCNPTHMATMLPVTSCAQSLYTLEKETLVRARKQLVGCSSMAAVCFVLVLEAPAECSSTTAAVAMTFHEKLRSLQS